MVQISVTGSPCRLLRVSLNWFPSTTYFSSQEATPPWLWKPILHWPTFPSGLNTSEWSLASSPPGTTRQVPPSLTTSHAPTILSLGGPAASPPPLLPQPTCAGPSSKHPSRNNPGAFMETSQPGVARSLLDSPRFPNVGLPACQAKAGWKPAPRLETAAQRRSGRVCPKALMRGL